MNKVSLTAYVDLLSCLLVFFIIAFAVVSLKMKENENDANMKSRAEFVITIDWEDNSDSDIDLFMAKDGKDIVYFGNKNVPEVFTLERDDLGTEDAQPIRREIVTIRNKQAGEYYISLVYWTKRTKFDGANVKVNVVKLNPFQEVHSQTYELTEQSAETFVVSFKVDSNGNVVEVNTVKKASVVQMAKDNDFLKATPYGSYGNAWEALPR